MIQFLIILIQALVIFLMATTAFAYMTLFERRLLARFQNRVGPNRSGPGGFTQPLADAIKLFFKEDIIPSEADKIIYTIAPALSMIPAILLFAVIPIGADMVLFGRPVPLQFTDLNVGVLFLLAVTSIGVYGITLGGWASANKYSMMGAIRSSAQLISYELALGLSVMVPIMFASSLSVREIVVDQIGWWNVFKPTGFIALCVFWIASTAEVVRAPFDLVEAEQELVGGYNTEYSSMKFALFFMAEYIKLIAISCIGVTLFLGGWSGPGVAFLQNEGYPNIAALVSVGYFLLKLLLFLFVSVWIRATLPRIKYDQLMNIGWKRLLPISLATVAATAVLAVFFGDLPVVGRLFG
jgi:NADH-quinone oxidoreductase subunit H